METGPFPVDKRGARMQARAENGEAFETDEPGVTAVARAGVVTARKLRPRRSLKELSSSSPAEPEPEEEGLIPPERNYDCPNYETCLGLAAALDWKSFTCKGCCGTVNQQLLWRAHHRIRNNPSLTRLCNLPVLTSS